MFSRLMTFAIDGVNARPVWVEVDVRPGLPSFRIVGMPDMAVREARERVRGAILNADYDFPARRITANLAPAFLRKAGPGFDAAIAVGILVASGQCPSELLDRWAIYGELTPRGAMRASRGTLAAAQAARSSGLRGLIVPRESADEAALADGLRVVAADDLRAVVAALTDEVPQARSTRPPAATAEAEQPDLADVHGQKHAVRALEIAAAGGHHVLLSGPAGSGKTMLARRLPGILPALTHDEAIEVTRIHSVAGIAHRGALASTRPFRAPHHTITPAGLVGGGAPASLGEASLAHRGVLFLDELPAFSRLSLQALRESVHAGHTVVVRGRQAQWFPTRFTLVAATGTCPRSCTAAHCGCDPAAVQAHNMRLRALGDPFDLCVAMQAPTLRATATSSVTTAAVRARVEAARERTRRRRLAHSTEPLSGKARRALLALGPACGDPRIVRVAGTIAALDGRDVVSADDVLEAAAYILSS